MSTTPLILVRALDSNWDVVWGAGSANFLTDLDAVAQIVASRLRLLEAEWWADQQDGLPFFQGIATAQLNVEAATLLIIKRILGTPFVNNVSGVSSKFSTATGLLQFSCTVQTQFGPFAVSSVPAPPPRSLPV